MRDNKPDVQVSVERDLSGQVVIGNNNVQIRQVKSDDDVGKLAEFDRETAVYLKHIMRGLQNTFSLSEMRLLCLGLSLDPASLNNATTVDMAHDLTMYAYRHDKMGDLVKICQTERPHYDWTAV